MFYHFLLTLHDATGQFLKFDMGINKRQKHATLAFLKIDRRQGDLRQAPQGGMGGEVRPTHRYDWGRGGEDEGGRRVGPAHGRAGGECGWECV